MSKRKKESKIQFEDSFFEAEEINGFYVRSMVKRAWAAELELLVIIDEVCRNHQITWFADQGTLLGAVREKGFIAWDDDIDIAMRRRDYERFIKYAVQELPDECYLCNSRSDEQWQLTCSVRNTTHLHLDEEHLDKWHGYPYAAAVDIYVYDNLPDSAGDQKVYHALLQAVYGTAMRAERGKYLAECPAEVQSIVTEITGVLGVKIAGDRYLRGQLLSLTDQIAAMYMGDETEELIQAAPYTGSPDKHFRTEWFSEIKTVRFMGVIDIPIPVGYDGILKNFYGDYLKPVRASYGHDYPVFKEMEQMLFEEYAKKGMPIPDYLKL